MAKDLQALRQDLKKVEAMVRDALPTIAILLTLSAKAISERNIKEQGFGYAYSENTVPAFFLKGKELNSVGERFIEDKIENDEETNWKELRAAQGLQNKYVDLTFSGTMWSNMAPGEVEFNGEIVTAPLVATNREVQNKMNWNRDRYGDFIGKSLTPENYDQLYRIVIEEVLKIIRESGLTFEI